MDYNYDPEYLLSPSTGEAKQERAIMEKYFPINYNFFQPQRMSRVGKFGRVIITASDGGTLLRTSLWNQIIELENIVYGINVEYEGLNFQYEDVCAKWDGICKSNEILNLVNLMGEIEVGQFNLTYPITFDPTTFQQYTLPSYFGGIDVSDIGTVKKVEAVSLNYFLDVTNDWQIAVGDQWERNFLKTLEEKESELSQLKITKFVSSTPAWEMEKSKDSITPNLLVNVGIMVIFCLFASSMADAVRSKPLIGFLGLFSAVLATIAGFGFSCYVGIEFIALCFAAPFLLLGIGIDDTFVMLSAWRRSPTHSTIPERMGLAYSEAAVSITVTSVTDFLSFFRWCYHPIPMCQNFCIYTGTAVGFIYVWQLTFFGACLALSGYAEKKNLHGMVCLPTTPKSQASNRNWLYRVFCTGGINPADPYNPKDNRDHAGMVFMRDKLGYALSLKWVKSIVLIIFTTYIVVAIWGITNVNEGLEKRNTVNFDSYSIKFYDMDDKYYKDFRYPINVIVSGDIHYSNPKMQAKIERMMQTFENSTYISDNLSSSWLRDFISFVERNKGYSDYEMNIETEHEFVSNLRNIYLSDTSSPLNLDVNFDEDFERIKSSRFLLQGFKVDTAIKETAMVTELRKICDEFSTDDFQVTVFHPYFIYIDQYLEIMPQTIQSVLVTSGFMMVVSFIMIPNPICSLWVAFSIMSIEAGVPGYMTWWGVNLDGIALINLIMCIGFSVDFSAHICYHYMSEEDKSPEERISASLYALGMPIIQGAISTILGVIGLGFAPSYVYITFFKMIFLVIFLGAAHGLILLPVLLSLFGPGSCDGKSSGRSTISTPSTTVSLHSTNQPSCYTVNLGFGTPGEYRRKDPLRYPVDHFQRRHTGSPDYRQYRKSEFNPERFTFVTRIADDHLVTAQSSRPTNGDSRLTPVPETEEHLDAVIKQLNKIGALSSQGHKSSKKDVHQHKSQEHMDHKKICRSKSHRPRTQTLNDKQMLKEKNVKPPLRKYNSFPYHMFMNEGGYSSDESIKSAFEEKR